MDELYGGRREHEAPGIGCGLYCTPSAFPCTRTRRKRGPASPARSPINKDPWCPAPPSLPSTHRPTSPPRRSPTPGRLHDSAAAARTVPADGRARRIQDLLARRHRAAHGRDCQRQHPAPDRRPRRGLTVSAGQQHRVEREHDPQTIENKRISELPLNGRQVYMLLQLTSGTLFTQTTFGATGFSGRARGMSTARCRFTAAGPATTSS